MGVGEVPGSGAAQGPHGEGGGGATEAGLGTTGAEADQRTTGAGDVRLAGCLFWWFEGRGQGEAWRIDKDPKPP